MGKFILTAFNQNHVEDQKYVRIQKDSTVYIIQRNKVEHLPKKTLDSLSHMELEYKAVGCFMIVKGKHKFGHLGIFHRIKSKRT